MEVEMKSITIHGIDDDLGQRIAEKSKEYGLSQNRTVKHILKTALINNRQTARKDSFSDLFGKWTKKEKEAFDDRIRDFETIDASDWQE
jgi:hypothetical protein